MRSSYNGRRGQSQTTFMQQAAPHTRRYAQGVTELLDEIPPVDGRRHGEVQTAPYLEEITDRLEETEVQTQTDPLLERPPTPEFVPLPSGIDAETQIQTGDLFCFDKEVAPLLAVLVGKTLHQAVTEVAEEEEIAAIRRVRATF
ncbi:radial spoke 3, partial [Kipferlia bialata]|eukprot:g10539.t1